MVNKDKYRWLFQMKGKNDKNGKSEEELNLEDGSKVVALVDIGQINMIIRTHKCIGNECQVTSKVQMLNALL